MRPSTTWKKPQPRRPSGSRHSRIAHSPSSNSCPRSARLRVSLYMTPLEIVFEVPPGIYQRAFRAYLWRKVGGFAIGAVLALLLAAAVAPSEPWLSGFLAGLAAAYLLNLARFYRRVASLARARDSSRVNLRIDDGGVRFRSERGDWTVFRHRIRAVRRFGEVVELDLGSDESPIWIPAQAVAGEPLARLLELAGGSPGPPA